MKSTAVLAPFALAIFLWPSCVSAAAYRFTTVTAPGGLDTTLVGINNAGQSVGLYFDGGVHSFLYQAGVFTPLDVPGSNPGSTIVTGINNLGETTGFYSATDGTTLGFLYSGGQFSTVGADAGFVPSGGLNVSEQIVGNIPVVTSAVLDAHTGVASPVNVPGSFFTEAQAINDRGTVTGIYGDILGQHGFEEINGSFVTLPPIFPVGINNLGQILDPSGLLLPDGNISPIIVPGSGFTSSNGLNDLGQIAGGFGSDGEHGFIATPVPEPGTLPLALGASSAAIVFRARRRRKLRVRPDGC